MVNPSLPFELMLAHLERAVNHALQYSMEWPDYADRLNHTLLRCELTPFQTPIYVRFEQGQISFTTKSSGEVDLVIKATPSALLDLLQHRRAGSQVNISGNASLAQTLQQAIHALKIDWEALLADQIGELSARQVSQFFDKFKVFSQRFIQSSLADTADYLVDEKNLLVSKSECDQFYKEVNTLRYDTDRLEARIRLLEVG